MGKPQRVDIHIIKKTGTAWNVKGGTLHLDASAKEGRGNLIMDKSYKNYYLKYVLEISPNGNNGLLLTWVKM